MTLLNPFLMASDPLVCTYCTSLSPPICLLFLYCPYWKTMVKVLFQEIWSFPLNARSPVEKNKITSLKFHHLHPNLRQIKNLLT